MNKQQEAIVTVLLSHPDHWVTRREIGSRVGLKKSPYLIHLIDDLVERGVIERNLGSWGGFSCWFYSTTVERVQPFVSFPVEDFFSQEIVIRGEDE